MKNLILKPLDKSSAYSLLMIIRNESREYMKYFTPYNWADESFLDAVANKSRDQFYGLFINKTPVGLYMLRGLDDGYEIPYYSNWISRNYKGFGLATLALKHAYTTCKLNGIKTMILKVHPNNTVAKNMYEKFGFRFYKNDVSLQDMIYRLEVQ